MSNVDVLRPRLRDIAIEVTSKCNLRCSYCWKADEAHEALPGANEDMTDAMISGLYHYCKKAGIDSVCLSAVGETTMHKGWHTRVKQFFDDPEIKTHLNSNFARLFDDDDLAALISLDSLQISIDSSDLAMLRKLRSRADIRTITYNIIRLRQKASEVGRRPFISVNCTLCRDNIGHIVRLAGFCQELGVDQLMLSVMSRLLLSETIMVGRHNQGMPETLDNLTVGETILLADQIAGAEDLLAGSSTGLLVDEDWRARIDAVIAAVRQGATAADVAAYFQRSPDSSACRQPWTSPMVMANGDVLPCCETGRGGPVVGNLTEASLEEILDGAVHRAVRASILDGRPTLPCRRCGFANPMSFEEFRRDIEAWQGDLDVARCPPAPLPGVLNKADDISFNKPEAR
jgi:MoaA/NifB/PqqE/SkfB family radical SAM enzyme